MFEDNQQLVALSFSISKMFLILYEIYLTSDVISSSDTSLLSKHLLIQL